MMQHVVTTDRWLRVVALFLVLILINIGRAGAQSGDPVVYERYDVTIEVLANGDFLVQEAQTITFYDSFSFAFAEIPTELTTAITDIQVYEDGAPYEQVGRAEGPGQYSVDKQFDAYEIEWGYNPVASGETRSFTLAYRVVGGLWAYPEETRLEWRAVPADRSADVRRSRITVILPQAVTDAVQWTTFGVDFDARVEENRIVFDALEMIPDGTRWQVLVGMPPDFVAAEPQPWQLAEDSAELRYIFDALDVELTILPDGTLDVTESHTLSVTAGALHEGRRTLPLAFIDAVTDVALFEGPQPFAPEASCTTHCLTVSRTDPLQSYMQIDRTTFAVDVDVARAGSVTAEWVFPPLFRGESTTFALSYRVAGALQLTDAGQRLTWSPAFIDRNVPIEQATLTVQLPPGVPADAVSLDAGGAQQVEGTNGRIQLVYDGAVPARQAWTVTLEIPPDATTAVPPLWQQRFERLAEQAKALQAEAAEREALAAQRRARQQLAAGVGGIVLLLGGWMLAGWAWYTRGRDPEPLEAYGFLSEPPSDLPPGIVAYLIDEKASARGVLASLFQLAGLGLLRIDIKDGIKLQRAVSEPLRYGQVVQVDDETPVELPDHVVTLFNALYDHVLQVHPVPLDAVAAPLQAVLPQVYAEMADEATLYFSQKPAQARHRWLVVGQWVVLLGALGTVCSGLLWLSDVGAVGLLPPVALAIVGLTFMALSRWMGQRTPAGVAEATRWVAFRQYLRDLKRRGTLDEAQKMLDDYFAYAVALGVDDRLLDQIEALGGFYPPWSYTPEVAPGGTIVDMGKVRRRRPTLHHPDEPAVRRLLNVRRRWNHGPGSRATMGERERFSLDDLSLSNLSRRLTGNLNLASAELTNVLNTAIGAAAPDTPFRVLVRGAGEALELSWTVTTTTAKVLSDIVEASAKSSGGGGGGYRGGSGWSSSSSRRSISRSSSSFGRSSGSRRSGGGGSRGFR